MYFQTDKPFRKYNQLINNMNVTLCIDNIQIEETCEETEHSMANKKFSDLYKEYFSSSYKMYSSLEQERLFRITPAFLERWIYEKGIPFLEIFDIKQQTYEKMNMCFNGAAFMI